MKLRVLQNLPLTALVILAAVLRLRGIGQESLWGDESLSVTIARLPVVDLIRRVIVWEQIPPVHHLLLKFWMMLFGSSEAAVRMPSALAGIAAVAVLYSLVKRLLGPGSAFAAALLLAVSPIHISFAHENRAYALAFLLSLICTDLFERLITCPTARLEALYVIVATLMLYTHLYGVFVLAAHGLTYLLFFKSRDLRPALPPRRWITIAVAVAILYSPWVPIVRGWMKAVAISFWVKTASWTDIASAYRVYSGSTPMLMLMTALVVIGVYRLWQRERRALTLLLSLAVLPVLVPVTLSVLTHPSFAPRYGLLATAGLFPLAGAGVSALFRPLRWIALLAIAGLSIASIDSPVTHIPKAPWRDAIAYLDRTAPPGDIVVVHIKAGSRLYNYYNKRPDLTPRPFDTPTLPVDPLTLKPGQHVWFVLYEQWHSPATMLRRGNWHIVTHKRFGDVLIMKLEGGDHASATQPLKE